MDKTINTITLKDRLREIVDISYRILCNKIVSKSISISNEASFQLQFGVILKQIGQLYEFDEKDRFYIQLEDVQTIDVTQKSPHGRARCDIMLSLKNGKDEFSVAIELKYFKKAEGETITDNRFRILCDIENLENYKKANSKSVGYQIVYTDNPNYANSQSTSYIKIGEGATLNAGKHSSNGRSVNLANSYIFKWDIYKDNNCFLKIEV
ncbi:MAG: hypothetical protein II271_03640 [Muribaculaceae bacterium]|nr:hypothetical protein [Muribaculaceae bacterium]